MDWTTVLIYAVGGLFLIIAVALRLMPRGPKIPLELRTGHRIPAFAAVDDEGQPVSTADLAGAPAVLIFVRGNWCPFCTKQVEKLTRHYREITSLGARLILVTPKPLETTRRVARFFEVEFDFWLDDGLAIADQLGLRLVKGVPKGYLTEYGPDTMWPTTIIVDANGIIRYSRLSRHIVDRPDPEKLVTELKKIQSSA